MYEIGVYGYRGGPFDLLFNQFHDDPNICLNDCSNHGDCHSHSCSCDDSFSGPICETCSFSFSSFFFCPLFLSIPFSSYSSPFPSLPFPSPFSLLVSSFPPLPFYPFLLHPSPFPSPFFFISLLLSFLVPFFASPF